MVSFSYAASPTHAPNGPGRNRTIDIAKGLGILLVVFGHNWILLNPRGLLAQVVYSFHVPLFFFLSGIFLKESEPISRVALSRARGLLQPYAVVMAFGALIVAVQQPQKLMAFVAGALYSGPVTPNPWGALWFLPHLFLALVLAAALIKGIGPRLRMPPVAVIVIGALLSLGLGAMALTWNRAVPELESFWHLLNAKAGMPGLPLNLDVLPISTAFVLIGWMVSPWVRQFRFRWDAFLAALMIFCACHAFLPSSLDLNLRVFTPWWLATLLALCGIYLVLGISSLLARWPLGARWLSYIGASSLMVLIFHVFFQARLTGFVASRWPELWVYGAAAGWVLGVAAPLLIGEGVKRSRVLSALLLPSK